MSSTTVIEAPSSHKLELHTAYGPVYRDVLNTEPRDATEEEVPIIDLAGLSSGLESRKEIAKALCNAGTNMGFFYIKNHGIDEEVVAKAKSQLLTFVSLYHDIKHILTTPQLLPAKHRSQRASLPRQVKVLQWLESPSQHKHLPHRIRRRERKFQLALPTRKRSRSPPTPVFPPSRSATLDPR